MNEIAIGMFFWLLKILGAYLALMMVLTIILSRWKKKSKQETDEISESRKNVQTVEAVSSLLKSLSERQPELSDLPDRPDRLCLCLGRSGPAPVRIIAGTAAHPIIQK